MGRWIVWVNSLPLLLPDGIDPTEENINKFLRDTGRSRLMHYDVINGVSSVEMLPIGDDLAKKYPEPAGRQPVQARSK